MCFPATTFGALGVPTKTRLESSVQKFKRHAVYTCSYACSCACSYACLCACAAATTVKQYTAASTECPYKSIFAVGRATGKVKAVDRTTIPTAATYDNCWYGIPQLHGLLGAGPCL